MVRLNVCELIDFFHSKEREEKKTTDEFFFRRRFFSFGKGREGGVFSFIC